MRTSQEIASEALPFEGAAVAHVMTSGVVACAPETPLGTVARMMSRHRVHAIVVLDPKSDGTRWPWGVVSDLDLVDAAARGALDDPAAGAARTPAVLVEPHATLEHAAALMARHRTTHLVVMNAAGHPLGVVSALDLARALAARPTWDELD